MVPIFITHDLTWYVGDLDLLEDIRDSKYTLLICIKYKRCPKTMRATVWDHFDQSTIAESKQNHVLMMHLYDFMYS
jgi:hypothetical protein